MIRVVNNNIPHIQTGLPKALQNIVDCLCKQHAMQIVRHWVHHILFGSLPGTPR